MNKSRQWTDLEIIEGIKNGIGEEKQMAQDALFNMPQLQLKAAAMAIKCGENPEYTHDVFMDAFILAERKIREGAFRQECSLSTWLISIVKWICISRRQKEGKRLVLPPLDSLDIIIHPELSVLTDERKMALHKALDEIGEFCKKLLLENYAAGYSMREIEDKMNMSNIKNNGEMAKEGDVAKEKVRQCKDKLRKMIENNPLLTLILKPEK